MTHHRILDPAGEAVEVTDHAIERFLERVDGRCSVAEAAVRIAACGRGIRAAARIGARVVRMPSGHRLMLAVEDEAGNPVDHGIDAIGTGRVLPRVVTVFPRGTIPDFHGRAFAQAGWSRA